MMLQDQDRATGIGVTREVTGCEEELASGLTKEELASGLTEEGHRDEALNYKTDSKEEGGIRPITEVNGGKEERGFGARLRRAGPVRRAWCAADSGRHSTDYARRPGSAISV